MSTQPILRHYQAEAVAAISQHYRLGQKRVVFQLPTGGGKTIVFSEIAARATARGKRIVITTHRQEIADQIGEALTSFGAPHGFVRPGAPVTDDMVQVCSVPSLVRRLARGVAPPADLIVVDECHHAAATTWRTIMAAYPDAYSLGVTATPERGDGQGLADTYDILVCGPSTAALTEHGYLVPARVFAPPQKLDLSRVHIRHGDFAVDELADVMSDASLVGDVVDHYRRLGQGRPAIVFCVNVVHSQIVAERLRQAGFRSAHVDGTTPADERRRLIAALGTDVQVLTNCGIVSEGLDVPGVHAAILARPTKSLPLYLQMVGRALRPAPDKTHALVLDHAGNSLVHGLPDAFHPWSLDGRPKKDVAAHGGGRHVAEPRRCPVCHCLAAPGTAMCEVCGTELAPTPAEVAEQLQEAIRTKQAKAAEQRQWIAEARYQRLLKWASGDADKLRQIAEIRGYRPGWIWHQQREWLQQAAERVSA